MNTRNRIHRLLCHLRALFERGIHFAFELCIKPRSANEDNRRQEFVLNTILCAVIPLLIILEGFVIWAVIREGSHYRGIPLSYFTLILIVFIYLLLLSRNGFYRLVSFLSIWLYFVCTTYGAIHWGVELPLVAISYVLIIVISSILISTRFGFIITAVIAASITAICLLQIHHFFNPMLFWKFDPVRVNDAIQLSVVFFVITAVSWLSNREMEKSLQRARASEQALAEERNLLEIKVEERTKELKSSQQEQLSQLSRFADFGRISAGVFHDLMNSLQGVVLNVSQLEQTDRNKEVTDHVAKAVAASKRMGSYIGTVRKQIRTDDALITTFLLEKEIADAMDMLQFHAREANAVIQFIKRDSVTFQGNPLKFYQVIFNLLSNAIDACDRANRSGKIIIDLSCDAVQQQIVVTVSDNGCGITDDILPHIFEPFFTTKPAPEGTGLGLSQTRDIVEKDLGGTIAVVSPRHKGSIFTITLPIITTHAAHKLSDDELFPE